MDSLRAVGFTLDEHDVTFTDGPWEAHSLDAWGSGWHVQLGWAFHTWQATEEHGQW